MLKQQLFFGDYNHDGYEEVYCITRVGDSLFLNAKELLVENGLSIENKFICRLKMFNIDQLDVCVVDAKTMDMNYDSKDDFIFTLSSGFSNQPRNTFVYDITNDNFIKSPLSASGFSSKLQYMDINGDGVEEITGNISAVENIHYEMPYTDSCNWLMVLNPADSLDFLFPPIKYDGVFGGLQPVLYTIKDEKYIVSTYTCNSVGKETDGFLLQLFDNKGELIKEKLVPYERNGVLITINPLSKGDKNIYYLNGNGKVFISDTSLNIIAFSEPVADELIINMAKNLLLDIDNDGENEILFTASRPLPGKLVIYRSSLKESTIVDLPESRHVLDWHVTLKRDEGKPTVIVLQAENIIYHIKYGMSEYYLLKYPTYLVFYLLLYFLFWLLQKGQNKLAERRSEEENQLAKQQMALSKKQLEPHFMLNTLNNIGAMFAKEDKEDAQYYFGKFASLIHRGLKYADQVETSLFEELEFVRDYLILQKQRFDGELDFTIESNEEIKLSEIMIPHSLIFTFVENAIKHGLRPKEGEKKLLIRIEEHKNKTIIKVTDNGIGRKQSKNLKTAGTGKGLGIVANIVESYNKLNARSISYEVVDLLDDNELSKGTEVIIEV